MDEGRARARESVEATMVRSAGVAGMLAASLLLAPVTGVAEEAGGAWPLGPENQERWDGCIAPAGATGPPRVSPVSSPARAGEQAQLEADSVRYRGSNGVYNARGAARLERADQSLSADALRYDETGIRAVAGLVVT
ncbi:MAG: hypothetical protein R6V11_08400, partial [Ectothiorhodospiraceae bacterium]